MRVQEYIEEAIQDILQARTYISTNSVTVARHTDREATNKGDLFVNIVAEGEERLSINHNLYNMEIGIAAVIKIQANLTGSSFDALWADISDEATQDMTISTLQAAINAINASSGITINGIVNMPSDLPQITDQYEQREQRIRISFTFS